jgi:hypothetical protein
MARRAAQLYDEPGLAAVINARQAFAAVFINLPVHMRVLSIQSSFLKIKKASLSLMGDGLVYRFLVKRALVIRRCIAQRFTVKQKNVCREIVNNC